VSGRPHDPGDDRSHAAAALVVLRARVDAHFEAAKERSPEQFCCGPGCHGCCLPGLGVFGIEAERIRGALRALGERDREARRTVRRQASDESRDRCALLVDGRCSIYGERPMLCRSHGLPVLGPDAQVSGCPLNFTTEDPPAPSVLELAAVDAPLAVMAQMWDGGARVPLADLARED
jgi:uncharacterized protein